MAQANKSGEKKVNSDQASKPLLFHGILFLTGEKKHCLRGPSAKSKCEHESASRGRSPCLDKRRIHLGESAANLGLI